MQKTEIHFLMEHVYLTCVSLRDLQNQMAQSQERLRALVASRDRKRGKEATETLVAALCLKLDLIPAWLRLPQGDGVVCRDENQRSTNCE
ncbi:hypothetical protein [Thermosporothrix hazakensis]|uniref:hypothetical protein n=1 Tax=Thermosporothrix hazakensis TaxID=644383 RepID=UPI0010DFC5D1|nr:hypothetical protein [Thermosporothrix hazakensis]GCE50489.1 hypothetical protein KTH_53580 [Thermosporothrix hazakensis]